MQVCAKKTDRHGGNVFDFISAGDLVVLAIAAVVTAVIIAVTHWWQTRRGRDDDAPGDGS